MCRVMVCRVWSASFIIIIIIIILIIVHLPRRLLGQRSIPILVFFFFMT